MNPKRKPRPPKATALRTARTFDTPLRPDYRRDGPGSVAPVVDDIEKGGES
jgi:hypothetical protein